MFCVEIHSRFKSQLMVLRYRGRPGWPTFMTFHQSFPVLHTLFTAGVVHYTLFQELLGALVHVAITSPLLAPVSTVGKLRLVVVAVQGAPRPLQFRSVTNHHGIYIYICFDVCWSILCRCHINLVSSDLVCTWQSLQCLSFPYLLS